MTLSVKYGPNQGFKLAVPWNEYALIHVFMKTYFSNYREAEKIQIQGAQSFSEKNVLRTKPFIFTKNRTIFGKTRTIKYIFFFSKISTI